MSGTGDFGKRVFFLSLPFLLQIYLLLRIQAVWT